MTNCAVHIRRKYSPIALRSLCPQSLVNINLEMFRSNKREIKYKTWKSKTGKVALWKIQHVYHYHSLYQQTTVAFVSFW